ncbi:putative lipoprotein [Magnetofaba australis IT-1]|uniref:Putative lipoprotein n=2 Tax=Magnetofaba TaxID=1472292 RepID=A0A1Y2K214_9PROT|nr:putative lipoprotein [Magnetofaba australis IT-1]
MRMGVVMAGLLLGGCTVGPEPVVEERFATLRAVEPWPQRELSQEGVALLVMPLQLPPYLNRPERVVEVGEYGHRLVTRTRWSEPLESLTTRVLETNLSRLLDSARVMRPTPGSRSKPQWVLDARVLRFDRAEAGDVVLEARWRLLTGAQRKELVTRWTRYEEPVEGWGGQATEAAMSQALGAFARDIAEVIKGFEPARSSR